MASYAKQIGDAVVTIIAALPAAPATVKYRKENAAYSRETPPFVFVTVGMEAVLRHTFDGSVLKTYIVRIMYARVPPTPGSIATELDTNPSFMLKIRQAFDTNSLTGVSAAWQVDVVESSEWEEETFGKGAEMSTIGLKVFTAEPQNG